MIYSLMLKIIFFIDLSKFVGQYRSIRFDNEQFTQFHQSISKNKFGKALTIGVIIFCLITWPVNWQLLGVESGSRLGNLGIGWYLGIYFLVFWFFKILFIFEMKHF